MYSLLCYCTQSLTKRKMLTADHNSKMHHVSNTFSYTRKTALTFIFRRKSLSIDGPPIPVVKREPNVVTMVGKNLFRNTWWCSVKTRLNYHSRNLIPFHPAVLISKDTAQNKACQTHRTYDARWPELYMEPTEYFITPRNQLVKLY